jgi:hypothetical protein
MIELNPQYEKIFDPRNIDDDCDKIAGLMSSEVNVIKEAMDAGLFKQAVTMYLQLLKAMCIHFVEDEHYCYFDDLYSPEYIMQRVFEDLQMCDLDFDSAMLLKEGHDEIMQTECYQEYGYPSYI